MLIGLRVQINGAGIAGLAVATALARRGARVTLSEIAPRITEVGAGLQISPNGFAVLAALGLHQDLLEASLISQAVELKDYRRGARVLRLDLARHHRGPHPFVLIHRARLIALLEAAARDAGVSINLGVRGGTDAPDSDLLIGADGLHSTLRPALNGETPAFFTGQAAWRAVIPDPDAVPEAHVYMGPGRHLVTYPLPGGLRNIVAVEERATWTAEGWNHPVDPATLRQAFVGFAPQVRHWLDRVEHSHLWGLHRHPVVAIWHDDARVLIGDAAHPTLPFLAQGANLALEDAWVLATCLADQPVPHALALYQILRQQRVTRAIAAANANARNYHLRNRALRLAAHTALRLGSALLPQAPLRKFDWLYSHDVTRA